MIVYTVLFVYLIIGSILKELKIKFGFQKYEILFICFFFSSSYGMGTDWIVYQNDYERMLNNLPPLNRFEFGYQLLCKAAATLGITYGLFTGIILFICNFILLSFIKKKSNNYYISFIKIIIVSLITLNFEPLMRQFIAITIVICGFRYIENRKFFKYIIFVFLACFFHKTAIITVLFYFFNYKKIKIKYMILFFLIVIFMSYKIIDIVSFIFYNINLLNKYIVYINDIQVNNIDRYKVLIKQIRNLIVILPVYLYGLKLKKNNYYIYNLSFITGINILLTYIIPMFGRLNHYLFIFYAICLSAIARIEKRSCNFKVLITLIYESFIITVSFFTLYTNNLDRYRYLNYKNYFIEYIFSEHELNFDKKLSNFDENIKSILKHTRRTK